MAMGAHTTAPAQPIGLPQFDPQWWPGQMLWLLVIFAVVFFLMRHVFVPRIGGTIAAREGKIEGDIAAARALKEEAEALARTAAAARAEAKAAAERVASDARDAAKAQVAQRLAEEEATLAKHVAAAEGKIGEARDAAMGHVRAIATDTAAAIIARLTGEAVTPVETKAAFAGRT